VRRLLGRLAGEANRLTEARRHYEAARGGARQRESRVQAEIENDLGVTLALLGETSEAVAVLASAVQYSDGNGPLHDLAQANLALACRRAGQRPVPCRSPSGGSRKVTPPSVPARFTLAPLFTSFDES